MNISFNINLFPIFELFAFNRFSLHPMPPDLEEFKSANLIHTKASVANKSMDIAK